VKTVLIKLILDSKRSGQCRAPSCGAALDWYRTFPGDKSMPVRRDAKPLLIEEDPKTGARLGVFDAADTHWRSGPARAEFKRR
jgi:hypothetical protein